jgi:hypothetical protein
LTLVDLPLILAGASAPFVINESVKRLTYSPQPEPLTTTEEALPM